MSLPNVLYFVLRRRTRNYIFFLPRICSTNVNNVIKRTPRQINTIEPPHGSNFSDFSSNHSTVHIGFAQSDLTLPDFSQDFMQTQPNDTPTSAPTETSEPRTRTTQDGFHPPAPSSLGGDSQPRSRSLSPSTVAAISSFSAYRLGAVGLGEDETLCSLNAQEERTPLPGERISAYENAAIPHVQQTMGFQVVRRSGPSSDGPSLNDCPNGTNCPPHYRWLAL